MARNGKLKMLGNVSSIKLVKFVCLAKKLTSVSEGAEKAEKNEKCANYSEETRKKLSLRIKFKDLTNIVHFFPFHPFNFTLE